MKKENPTIVEEVVASKEERLNRLINDNQVLISGFKNGSHFVEVCKSRGPDFCKKCTRAVSSLGGVCPKKFFDSTSQN